MDMSKISYLDSSGIGVLVKCSALVKNSGGQLRLAAVEERVMATLRMLGLEGVLAISTSRDEAVSAIALGN
jgi:anti-sigma B factor antagonist